jgi:hypothetical protein
MSTRRPEAAKPAKRQVADDVAFPGRPDHPAAHREFDGRIGFRPALVYR